MEILQFAFLCEVVDVLRCDLRGRGEETAEFGG